MRPELDNHWALRDFAARLMSQICKNFNTSTNNLQTRVTRLFSQALQNDKTHLSSLYGAIAGLSELGSEVIKVFIIPRLKFISDRIESHLQGTSISNTDKLAAGHIRTMLQKACAPVLKTIRNMPDVVEDYKWVNVKQVINLKQTGLFRRNNSENKLSVIQSCSFKYDSKKAIFDHIAYIFKLKL